MAVVSGQRKIVDTPSNRQLNAVLVVSQMVTHTYKITSNEKIFNHKYDRFLDKLLDNATDIQTLCVEANNVFVNDRSDFIIRMKLQEQAIRKCKTMLTHVSTARYLYKLRGKKAKYWSDLVFQSLNYVKNWHKGDYDRYMKNFKN